MIQLKDITLGYQGRILLENATAEFNDGRLTALVGRNGSGKSTLLRCISASVKPVAGQILLDGEDVFKMQPSVRAKSVASVTTERVRISNLCCRDLVALGRAPYTNWFGKMQAEDEETVMNSLRLVGMEDFAFRTMDKMSDGECQRVMIARALAQDTPNLILDEPTSFLDIPNRRSICRLLASLAHEHGKCVVFSTHEIEIALSLCDYVAVIDNGSFSHIAANEFLRGHCMTDLFGE